MAGEEESTATQTGEEAGAAIRDSIVDSGMPDLDTDEESQPEKEVALDAEHLTDADEAPDASASETPTDDTGATDEKPEDAEQTDEEKAAADEAAKAEAAEEAALNELLGVEEEESEDPLVLRQRHSEATRTIHAQGDEMTAMREALKLVGREFVHTADGIGVAVTADAKDFDVSEIDLNAITKSLTQDEKDSLASSDPEEGLKAIAKKMRAEFASRVPPITARAQDAILGDRDRNEVWGTFCETKRKGGKPLYPDANKPDVIAQMEKVFQSLPEERQELAARSKGALRAEFENSYLKVQRWRQAKVELAKHRAAKVAEQTELNKKGLAVQGSGSETKVRAQSEMSKARATLSQNMADQIANAGNDDAPPDDE